jgi:hypothetical protein
LILLKKLIEKSIWKNCVLGNTEGCNVVQENSLWFSTFSKSIKVKSKHSKKVIQENTEKNKECTVKTLSYTEKNNVCTVKKLMFPKKLIEKLIWKNCIQKNIEGETLFTKTLSGFQHFQRV